MHLEKHILRFVEAEETHVWPKERTFLQKQSTSYILNLSHTGKYLVLW
jgi:hypothetical protein